jgi:hypothetical protein
VMGSEKANGDCGGLYLPSIRIWRTVQYGTGVEISIPSRTIHDPLKIRQNVVFDVFVLR